MKKLIKKFINTFPMRIHQELKRLYYARKIKKNLFVSGEKEFTKLDEWINNGDWVLDVGANVGHYTKRMSDLVGPEGRVIAFEPIPYTFELLAANIALLASKNVSLINLAVSDSSRILGMIIPKFDTGLDNYYMANITSDDPTFSVLTMTINSLKLTNRVKLAKIDVEGHELSVLKGMDEILDRDHPRLIVEGRDKEVEKYLESHGYEFEEYEGSPNRIYYSRS